MTFSPIDVEEALRAEDIENLLVLGAPGDEYASEAKQIASALASLSTDKQTQANVAAIIALVWVKAFGLSGHDMEKRMPAFQRIAQRLL